MHYIKTIHAQCFFNKKPTEAMKLFARSLRQKKGMMMSDLTTKILLSRIHTIVGVLGISILLAVSGLLAVASYILVKVYEIATLLGGIGQ